MDEETKTFAETIEPMAQKLATGQIVGLPVTIPPESAGNYAKVLRKLAQTVDAQRRALDAYELLEDARRKLRKEVAKGAAYLSALVVLAYLYN